MNIFNRVTTLRGYAVMFKMSVHEVVDQIQQGVIVAKRVEGTNDYLIQLPDEKANELDRLEHERENDPFSLSLFDPNYKEEPVQVDLNEYFTINYKDTSIQFNAFHDLDDSFKFNQDGTASTYIHGTYRGISNYTPVTVEFKLEKPYVEAIESIRCVDEQLRNRELAGKGEREVVIMVDGNRHKLSRDGERIIFKTKVTDNFVSIEQCKKIVEKIKEEYNYQPKKLEFLLSLFTETPNNNGEVGEHYLLNKRVVYDVAFNVLDVYIDDKHVYQNYDGEERRG